MATQAISFTKVHTKPYKVWRILQAPGAWNRVYRNREARLRHYRSAIIFPEQILGLNQASIYKVVVVRGSSGDVESHISTLRSFGLFAHVPKDQYGCFVEPGRISSTDELSYWESQNSENGDTHRLMVSSGSDPKWSFDRYDYFTNIRDAVKFQQREQEKLISQIG